MKLTQTAGYVYLIGELDGCHKIGFSTSPERRLRQLPLGASVLRVVYTIASPRQEWLERYLHVAFAHRRVRGEWFRLDAAELAMITSIPAADKAEDLPPEIVSLHQQNILLNLKPPAAVRNPVEPNEPGSVADVLDKERRLKNLSMNALARAAAVPKSRVHAVLTGVNPNPGIETVRAILRGLDQSLAWLEKRLNR